MAAERERRKKILDTQAMINVAEGHKQRVILESEGGKSSFCHVSSPSISTPIVLLPAICHYSGVFELGPYCRCFSGSPSLTASDPARSLILSLLIS